MKKNWSSSVMYMTDRVAILKRMPFMPRRGDILKVKSDLSGVVESFKIWSLTFDYTKKTIVIQVVPVVK